MGRRVRETPSIQCLQEDNTPEHTHMHTHVDALVHTRVCRVYFSIIIFYLSRSLQCCHRQYTATGWFGLYRCLFQDTSQSQTPSVVCICYAHSEMVKHELDFMQHVGSVFFSAVFFLDCLVPLLRPNGSFSAWRARVCVASACTICCIHLNFCVDETVMRSQSVYHEYHDIDKHTRTHSTQNMSYTGLIMFHSSHMLEIEHSDDCTHLPV